MGRISAGIGLVSGINSKDIIDQLMSLEARGKDRLQSRIELAGQTRLAYTDLSTRLTGLRISATLFKKPSTFSAATTTSSNPDVLTATASTGATIGSYQFQVARLVTTQQAISRGFTDFSSANVGAGTLTIEMGGGELQSPVMLAQLNGGDGIRRGMFRITDRAGNSAVIDTTAAVTLDDVVKKVNTSLDISVKATIGENGLEFEDLSGGAGNFIITDLGGGHAAEDLKIATVPGGVASSTFAGGDVNSIGASTALASLNDGRGVRTATSGADFTINTTDGSTFDITLGASKTVQDVMDLIQTTTGGKVTVSVAPGSNALTLTDTTGSGGLSVVAIGTSKAAADLGIVGTGTGNTLAGADLTAGLNTVLVSSLNGGNGFTLADVNITDKAGTLHNVDLSAARSVHDILDTLNAVGGGTVFQASLNPSKNGIQIKDLTGGTGSLTIAEGAGTTAADLGLVGTYTTDTVSTKNLQRQWVSENTLLSTYNGGRGVTPGKFKLTNSLGASAVIDLTQGNEIRLSDVISEINARNLGVTARVNDTGDGLLLEDTAGGAGKLTVEEQGTTTAADLNIKGVATGTTINGSFEKTITVEATDTLKTVQEKINNLGFGLGAQIINDGSGLSPYRLSLTAKNSGLAGRVVFDAGTTTLGTTTLVQAQDAAVFVGSASAESPLLVTASRNQIGGIVPGVTVELHGVSDSPVTLNVTPTTDKAVEEMEKFVTGFNELVDKIAELTKWDPDPAKRGMLFGDDTIRSLQTEIFGAFTSIVDGAGKYRTFGQVGVRMVGGKLEFDADKFRESFAADPEGVKKLFTLAPLTSLDSSTKLDTLNKGRGVRTAGAGLDDFRMTLRDGTTVDVNLETALTIGDVIREINNAGAGKVTAAIDTKGTGLTLTDATGGAGAFSVGILNSSLAAYDLGIVTSVTSNTISGEELFEKVNPLAMAPGMGLGTLLETRLNRVIDPVSGIIPRENKNLDNQTLDWQKRISNMDKLLEQKRLRLERQFAQLESVLSGLQSQQTALGQIQSIQPVRK